MYVHVCVCVYVYVHAARLQRDCWCLLSVLVAYVLRLTYQNRRGLLRFLHVLFYMKRKLLDNGITRAGCCLTPCIRIAISTWHCWNKVPYFTLRSVYIYHSRWQHFQTGVRVTRKMVTLARFREYLSLDRCTISTAPPDLAPQENWDKKKGIARGVIPRDDPMFSKYLIFQVLCEADGLEVRAYTGRIILWCSVFCFCLDADCFFLHKSYFCLGFSILTEYMYIFFHKLYVLFLLFPFSRICIYIYVFFSVSCFCLCFHADYFLYVIMFLFSLSCVFFGGGSIGSKRLFRLCRWVDSNTLVQGSRRRGNGRDADGLQEFRFETSERGECCSFFFSRSFCGLFLLRSVDRRPMRSMA